MDGLLFSLEENQENSRRNIVLERLQISMLMRKDKLRLWKTMTMNEIKNKKIFIFLTELLLDKARKNNKVMEDK